MRCFLPILGLMAATSSCDSDGASVPGDTAFERDQGDMAVVYYAADEVYADLDQVFRDSGLFESIADEFNAEFALPGRLEVSPAQCGEANAFYSPDDDALFLCYELLIHAYATFRDQSNLDDDRAFEVALDVWLWVFYHELGHALIDLYALPVTAREEDSVDRFATVLFVNDGRPEVAFYAAAYWKITAQSRQIDDSTYADEHALNLQRAYDTLCLVYGSDPSSELSAVIRDIPEMADRLPRCTSDWDQASSAWAELLRPWTFSPLLQ